jgi:hypothetical protein
MSHLIKYHPYEVCAVDALKRHFLARHIAILLGKCGNTIFVKTAGVTILI